MAVQLEVNGFTGVNEMIRELRATEPEIYRQLRKDLIQDVKPLYAVIKSRIPPIAPLSGMYHNGRTRWNQPVRVSAKINLRRRAGVTTLLSVRTMSPAVEMVDMAGSASDGNTPQGRAMIANLSGKASRYVWPAANSFLPEIIKAANATIERYSKIKNARLEKL